MREALRLAYKAKKKGEQMVEKPIILSAVVQVHLPIPQQARWSKLPPMLMAMDMVKVQKLVR